MSTPRITPVVSNADADHSGIVCVRVLSPFALFALHPRYEQGRTDPMVHGARFRELPSVGRPAFDAAHSTGGRRPIPENGAQLRAHCSLLTA